MHLGKCKDTNNSINILHSALHPKFGLVWTDGKAIYLTPNACNIKDKAEINKLGQFQEVKSLHWSMHGDYLAVNHSSVISVWKIRLGSEGKVVCQQLRKIAADTLSQGCLWNPHNDMLALTSKNLTIFYSDHTSDSISKKHYRGQILPGNCKNSAACWLVQGHRYITAFDHGQFMIHTWPTISDKSSFTCNVVTISELEKSPLCNILPVDNITIARSDDDEDEVDNEEDIYFDSVSAPVTPRHSVTSMPRTDDLCDGIALTSDPGTCFMAEPFSLLLAAELPLVECVLNSREDEFEGPPVSVKSDNTNPPSNANLPLNNTSSSSSSSSTSSCTSSGGDEDSGGKEEEQTDDVNGIYGGEGDREVEDEGGDRGEGEQGGEGEEGEGEEREGEAGEEKNKTKSEKEEVENKEENEQLKPLIIVESPSTVETISTQPHPLLNLKRKSTSLIESSYLYRVIFHNDKGSIQCKSPISTILKPSLMSIDTDQNKILVGSTRSPSVFQFDAKTLELIQTKTTGPHYRPIGMLHSLAANDFLIALVDNSPASSCFPVSSSSSSANPNASVTSDPEAMTLTSNRLDLALCLRTLQYLPDLTKERRVSSTINLIQSNEHNKDCEILKINNNKEIPDIFNINGDKKPITLIEDYKDSCSNDDKLIDSGSEDVENEIEDLISAARIQESFIEKLKSRISDLQIIVDV